MKYISLEKVRNIIQFADQAYPETIESQIVDGPNATLETIQVTCPKEQLLYNAITALDKDEFAEFCALFSVGQGVEADLFDELVAENIVKNNPVLADELTKGSLAMYLRSGLSKLSKRLTSN
jgi:hypothetical protein